MRLTIPPRRAENRADQGRCGTAVFAATRAEGNRPMEILIGLLLWIGSMAVGVSQARAKRRSVGGWFILTFLFGPFAAIILLALPRRSRSTRVLPKASPAVPPLLLRSCPKCSKANIAPSFTHCPMC